MRTKVLAEFPEALQRQLATHLHRNMLVKIPVFRDIVSPYRENFLVDLYMKMRCKTFCELYPVALKGHLADHLCVITHGQIRAAVSIQSTTISTLNPGDFFGENSLFGKDQTWMTSWGVEADFYAMSFCMCLTLNRDDFEEVMESYPIELQQEVQAIGYEFQLKRQKTAKIGNNIPLLRWGQLISKVLQSVEALDQKMKNITRRAILQKEEGIRMVPQHISMTDSLRTNPTEDDKTPSQSEAIDAEEVKSSLVKQGVDSPAEDSVVNEGSLATKVDFGNSADVRTSAELAFSRTSSMSTGTSLSIRDKQKEKDQAVHEEPMVPETAAHESLLTKCSDSTVEEGRNNVDRSPLEGSVAAKVDAAMHADNLSSIPMQQVSGEDPYQRDMSMSQTFVTREEFKELKEFVKGAMDLMTEVKAELKAVREDRLVNSGPSLQLTSGKGRMNRSQSIGRELGMRPGGTYIRKPSIQPWATK